MKLTPDHRPNWGQTSIKGTPKRVSLNSGPSAEQSTTFVPQPQPSENYTPSPVAPTRRILTQAERKALIANLAQTSAKSGLQHAVVVGGGPGGLAAAITLAKLGAKVTVLEIRADEKGEKPAHARPHQISLRQDALETLKELGAYEEIIEKSGFVDREVHLSGDHAAPKISEKTPKAHLSNPDQFMVFPSMLQSDAVSQVRISDIEKSLYDQAKELGVEVRAGVQATLVPTADGKSHSVEIQKVKNSENGFAPYGEVESLGRPDLVVVADGAGSPTRQSLGIEVKEESALKHYLGGHVQKGISAETRKAAITEKPGFTRHVMGTGHAQYDQTWVSVEITPAEAALSPKERTELLADKAQYVMGDGITTEDIGWGAGQLTTVQNRRAERTTAGDNVVLIGDSAGTGSVWVGGGLNLALTTHLGALKNLAGRLGAGDKTGNAMEIYDRSIQWATSEWHKAGAAELGVA